MYYIEKDNKIVLYDEDFSRISMTRGLMPEYADLEIKETTRPIENFEFSDTAEYEEEQAQKERMRKDMLNLTKADVLLALYSDKGITPDDIKTMLKDNTAALIKFDYASSYYRGDEVVNSLGLALGYTSEDMDYLFENKAFPPKADVPADTDSDNDGDTDSDIANDDGSEEENPSVVQAENPDSTGDTDTEL